MTRHESLKKSILTPTVLLISGAVCAMAIVSRTRGDDAEKAPNLIRAQRIEIVNVAGKTVLRLEAGVDGNGELSVYSKTGSLLLRLPELNRSADTKQTTAANEGWRDRAKWRTIRIGMNHAEIESLLGVPGKISQHRPSSQIWYYPDAAGGHVSFTDGRVNSWSEP